MNLPTVQMKLLLEHATVQVLPIYPAIANAAHVTGMVVVGVEVDATGKETQAVVLSGPEMLRSAALDAARQWQFRPIEVNGAANRVRSAIEFKFSVGNTSRGTVVTPK